MRNWVFISIAVVLLVVTANADLIAHWKLDGNANDSAGTYDGIQYGGIYTTGKDGSALTLNGDGEYVDVGDVAGLNFDEDDSFSITAWIKLNNQAAGVTDYRNTIVGKRDHDGNAWHEGYCFWVQDGRLFFGIEDSVSNDVYIWSDMQLEDGIWYHVAAVRDTASDNLYIYLNGSYNATPVEDITTGSLAKDEPLNIGRCHGDNYFKGLLDDICIFDQALSQTEIQAMVPEPATMVLLGLGAWALRKIN